MVYLEDSDIDGNIGCISPTDTMKRRHPQDTTTAEYSKRQRKPSQKAREMDAIFDDV
jgi:hypothetical protein